MKLLGSGSKRLCKPETHLRGHRRCPPRRLASNAIAAAPSARLDDELAFRSALNDSSSRNTRAIADAAARGAASREFAAFAVRALRSSMPMSWMCRLPCWRAWPRTPRCSAFTSIAPPPEFDYRTSITVGSLAVNQSAEVTGAGIGVAVIDSGIAVVARRPDEPSRRARIRSAISALPAFVDFVDGAARRMRRQRPRHARRRHHRRQRLRLATASRPASRPTRTSSR